MYQYVVQKNHVVCAMGEARGMQGGQLPLWILENNGKFETFHATLGEGAQTPFVTFNLPPLDFILATPMVCAVQQNFQRLRYLQ